MRRPSSAKAYRFARLAPTAKDGGGQIGEAGERFARRLATRRAEKRATRRRTIRAPSCYASLFHQCPGGMWGVRATSLVKPIQDSCGAMIRRAASVAERGSVEFSDRCERIRRQPTHI